MKWTKRMLGDCQYAWSGQYFIGQSAENRVFYLFKDNIGLNVYTSLKRAIKAAEEDSKKLILIRPRKRNL